MFITRFPTLTGLQNASNTCTKLIVQTNIHTQTLQKAFAHGMYKPYAIYLNDTDVTQPHKALITQAHESCNFNKALTTI